MRKAVAFAALALSAAMLTSCAGSKTETADTKTYTGSATGMDSVVTATLTMEGDKITNVEIEFPARPTASATRWAMRSLSRCWMHRALRWTAWPVQR